MVDTIRCEHCGAETKHPVTKTMGGASAQLLLLRMVQVYELMGEEGLLGQVKPEEQREANSNQGKVSSNARQLRGTGASEEITLTIVGMTCARCVARVEGSLRSVPGVLNANVSLATECATVEMILGAATIADLKHAVEKAGYKMLDLCDSDEELVDPGRASHG